MSIRKQAYMEASKKMEFNIETNDINYVRKMYRKLMKNLENKTINNVILHLSINFNDFPYIEKNPHSGEEREANPYYEDCY